MKYGPKVTKDLILKEINRCILLLLQRFSTDGLQLDELSKYLIFWWGHKSFEVRNEAISIIKQIYMSFGDVLKDYLTDIKASTMSVIMQELDSVELPEHLKAKPEEPKYEEIKQIKFDTSELYNNTDTNEDDFLTSPVRSEKDSDEDSDGVLSETPEKSEEIQAEIEHIPEPPKSNNSSQKKKKIAAKKIPQSKSKPQKVTKIEPLEIKDVGDKEVRDRRDSKAIWSPGEIRTDIISKIRDQIKAAFGSEIEKDWFSSDFKKHIQCVKIFSTAFDPDYEQIDHFFCTIDLIIKWIFVKGTEGSSTNTKFLLEILDFIQQCWTTFEEQAYELMEGEGIILLTFLIDKVSNSNSTIRDQVKDLIFKVCSNEGLYPTKASFKLLMMTGINNKNSKIK